MKGTAEVAFNIDRELASVKAALAEHATAIHGLAKRAREDVIEIGRRLHEVHKLLEGKWLAWVDAEFGWSDQTARRFIHVYELSQDGRFNNLLSQDLPVSLLYELAAPKAVEARTELAERIEAGEELSCVEVKGAIARAKGAAKPEAAAGQADDGGVDQDDHDDGDHTDDAEAVQIIAPQVTAPTPVIKTTSKFPKSAQRELHQVWLAGAPEDRDSIRDTVLKDFFAAASGTDIYSRIPAATRADVVRDFLDQLRVAGMLEAMSPEFGRELRARADKLTKRTTLNLVANPAASVSDKKSGSGAPV
jgi:hypothetical protein